jgi:hypothetical protein
VEYNKKPCVPSITFMKRKSKKVLKVGKESPFIGGKFLVREPSTHNIQ